MAVNSQKATGPAVGLYPHNMHPGLVPGIGVEDQRTDEEGENVDYDFKTDTWSDGYDPNSEQKET